MFLKNEDNLKNTNIPIFTCLLPVEMILSWSSQHAVSDGVLFFLSGASTHGFIRMHPGRCPIQTHSCQDKLNRVNKNKMVYMKYAPGLLWSNVFQSVFHGTLVPCITPWVEKFLVQ